MPALVAFGRRWRIASDDLTFPSITEFFIRIVWVIVIVVLYIRNGVSIGCSGSGYLTEFLMAMISIQGLVLINLIAIIVTSMRGTITNAAPREHMSKLLYVRTFLFIAEFICYIFGSYAISDPNLNCKNQSIIWLMFLIILLSWILFVIVCLFVMLVFNPLGSIHESQTVAKSIKSWERQVKVICCCCFCGFNKDEQSQNAYQDIAELITIFIKDVDLVASDVAAALILLASAQKQPVTPKPVSITSQPTNVALERKPWMNAQMANQFIRFAVASYGWPMFMYEHLCTGLCRLWPKITCCCCTDDESIVIDDNCCMCHMAAMQNITKAKRENFLYVSFYNRVYQTPFYVLVDHNTKSIVVTIRGTISQRDVLTDLTAECQIVDWIDSDQVLCAHKGMHSAAQFVYQKLLSLGVLEEAFVTYPDYDLVVTGHSLGAGTASILALLLRQNYPNLHCYAFSPPGCLFNKPLHELSKNTIMSVVVGNDLVISTTWQSMENFKHNLVNIVNQCSKPKYKVLVGGCLSAACGSSQSKGETATDLRVPLLTDQVGSVPFYSTDRQHSHIMDVNQPTYEDLLFPPGFILHIQKLEHGYTSSWADPSEFSYLKVSTTMGSDHMPNYVQTVLKELTSSDQAVDV